MEGILNHNKGQSPMDAIYLLVFLVLLAIAGIITSYIYSQLSTQLLATPEINATPEAVTAIEAGQSIQDKWDYLFLFLFIGFAIALMIIGYFIDVHSIFMVLYVIGMVIGVIVAMIMSYIYDQLTSANILTVIANDSFPITNHIIGNFGLYFTVIAALAFIATYAKTREANAG